MNWERYIKPAAIALILVSLLTALWLDYYRLSSEQANKAVSILIDYDEATALSRANNTPAAQILQRFAQAGASGVMIRERTAEDLAKTKDINVVPANNLSLIARGDPAPFPGLEIKDGFTYLIFKNRQDYENISAQLAVKRNSLIRYEGENAYVLGVYLTEKGLEKLGLGFLSQDVGDIAEGGLDLVPRIREWGSASPQSLEVLRETLRNLPELSLITFNDDVVPAANNLPGLAEALQDIGAPVGTFEFFSQQGLTQLGYLLGKNVVRVHSISENDMLRLSPAQALERYKLAVSERNIRVLYVRLFGMGNPDTALESSLEFIKNVKTGVEMEGFRIGQGASFAPLPYSGLLMLLMGFGVVAAGLLLLEPFMNSRWLVILGLTGLAGWFGLFAASPVFARKAAALMTVIIFPLLGISEALEKEGRSFSQAVIRLLKMSLISLCGAVIMTGFLADKSYMLKLDGFSGVKLAHAAPIALLFVLIILNTEKPWSGIRKLATAPVTYLYAFGGLFVLAALAVFIIRTGNEGTFLVSSWETAFREALDRLMGVRPRTKEFLLGHPFMLAVLYYGFDLRKSAVLLFGLIGQISLINTYAHIHTPLLISLTRTFHGLWLGILIGIILILIINCLIKRWAGRLQSE